MSPFREEIRRGVLVLTLDTPGGAVNVFTREAGEQLCTVLRGLSPSDVRAVVVRTAKTRSFVNGVGLLMAGTLKSVDDAVRMTGPVRAAYRALRNCPVPTIAAIQGNCYGCGVELAIHCHHRVAADTFDTHFYMTELADYVFIPTFGGTQDLPRLLGFERAAEFVLWGPRWSAATAAETGRVDRCFAAESFDDDLDRFVDEVAAHPGAGIRPVRVATAAEELRVVDVHRARIAKMPPAYRDVYLDCLALMQSAAVKGRIEDADYMNEAREAARTILDRPCRAAWPFFFLRQMATAVATAGAGRATSRDVRFVAVDAQSGGAAAELTMRCAPALRKEASADAPAERVALRAFPLADVKAEASRETAAVLSVELANDPRLAGGSVLLHMPLRAVGIDVVEVAGDDAAGSRRVDALAAALADGDFTVLRSRPESSFVVDELVAAWIAPQIAYIAGGGSPANLAASLRAFGFMRQAGDWVGHLPDEALSKVVRRVRPDLHDVEGRLHDLPVTGLADGDSDAAIVSALLVSLGAFAARTLNRRALSHASVVDVAARDIVDFPLLHTSLCRHVTRGRAQSLLGDTGTFARWTSEADITTLQQFVTHGREHYVGQ
jgi:enoyl-CoA hydratase/carnithine racemase